jgi:hypothetical protein
VRDGVRRLAADVDVIVLAQASMARVVESMPANELTVPILASPRLGVTRAAELLRSTAAAAPAPRG